VYQLAGIALALVALVVLARRTADAAVPWAFIASLFLLLTGGVADVGTLTHSQLPTTLPSWLDRLTVALTIGVGAGVAIVAALHVTPEPGRDRMRAIRATRGSGAGPR
jgi:Flp pilus assembly protein TadB